MFELACCLNALKSCGLCQDFDKLINHAMCSKLRFISLDPTLYSFSPHYKDKIESGNLLLVGECGNVPFLNSLQL